MIELLILAGVGWAGYIGRSGWWAIAGATAMTALAWGRKLNLLRRHPQVPLSAKMTTYLIVSVGINFGFAMAALIAGRIAAWWVGG